jgi:single-strand DNA-binding protein
MSVNKVMLIGNVGAEVELKYSPNGRPTATLRIATNEQWKDANGQKQERTDWHRVVVWGPTAENCAKYLTKGRSVYVEGRIQTRSWTDKQNEKHYTTEIIASRVQFLGGPGQGRPTGTQPTVETHEASPTEEMPAEDIDTKDIPL